MRRLLAVLLPALSLLVTRPGTVFAGVPSPSNSTVPACMALCPLGDLPFTVVVRDIANIPLAGTFVVLDFTACPRAFLCPSLPLDPYTVDGTGRRLRRATAANGSVTFPARVGGTAPAGCVWVLADGVLLGQVALASPDQDGDGQVVSAIGADDATFAAKLGSHDPTADFDCSGTVDAADEAVFFRHHSHGCYGYVDPTLRRSWGAVKLHYR